MIFGDFSYHVFLGSMLVYTWFLVKKGCKMRWFWPFWFPKLAGFLGVRCLFQGSDFLYFCAKKCVFSCFLQKTIWFQCKGGVFRALFGGHEDLGLYTKRGVQKCVFFGSVLGGFWSGS